MGGEASPGPHGHSTGAGGAITCPPPFPTTSAKPVGCWDKCEPAGRWTQSRPSTTWQVIDLHLGFPAAQWESRAGAVTHPAVPSPPCHVHGRGWGAAGEPHCESVRVFRKHSCVAQPRRIYPTQCSGSHLGAPCDPFRLRHELACLLRPAEPPSLLLLHPQGPRERTAPRCRTKALSISCCLALTQDLRDVHPLQVSFTHTPK